VAAEHDIDHVAVFRCEMLALGRAAGVHDRGERLLDRLGLQIAFLDLEEAAIEIERLFPRPKLLDDVEPLHRAVVAVVVLHQRRAEHLDFRPIPAGDDIDGEAAVADVIDGGRLLGRHHRMDRRHVRGREDAGIVRGGAHASGPGEALEAGAVEVGLAAEAVPTADRHQRLEFHLFRNLRQRKRARPVDAQDAVDRRDGAAAIEIGAEGPELELAIVEYRVAAPARLVASGHFRP
jgi:hypothetical protein